MGKLTPVRPKAIRAAVSSFNFNQAGVASEIKALLGDTSEGLSGDATAALLDDAAIGLSGETSAVLSEVATEALLGDTTERLDKAYSLKGQ